MDKAIQKIYKVWKQDPNRGIIGSVNEYITFDNLVSNVVSTGPFYFYVIDFETMKMSQVRDSIADILGFDPATVTFGDILQSFHPDDIDFIAKAEAASGQFFYKNIESRIQFLFH